MYATKLLPFDTNVVAIQETPDVWLYQALKEVFPGDVFHPDAHSQRNSLNVTFIKALTLEEQGRGRSLTQLSGDKSRERII